MSFVQKPLFVLDNDHVYDAPFPSTRFQGSKRKLADWIWANTKDLQFDSVLDVFGGTDAISHFFKSRGKQVTYNDNLKFNWQIGTALIQNADTTLPDHDIEAILTRLPGVTYPSFIAQTFHDIYFTDDENQWLDQTVYHIDHFLPNPMAQALARFALFQACLIK